MDVGGWLRRVGLGQYEGAFVKNAIGSDVLPELTEADLEKLEIPLGDRKRLIKAIRATVADSPGTTIANETGEDAGHEQPLIAIAERRHLTVMICDLVGSTALSARLDPEDMNAVMDAFQAACTRIIQTYDGFLANFRGDGILAYFGYPRAHEDDAERTVRAALNIIAEVVRLKTPAAEPLAVRIGIATGLVVVGDLSGASVLREHAVVGDTPNLAARLQALAEPGMAVVASPTRQLLGNLFRLRDLGSHEMKGFAEPVEAWAVEGVSDAESRFDSGRVIKLTDLVGRKARGVTNHSMLPQRTRATADHHQAGGDANADRERLVRARLEPCNSSSDIEPRAHGSLGIVLVRAGIAEIDQYPVAPEIGKEAVKG